MSSVHGLDQSYFVSIFQALRIAYDHTLGFLAIPFIYIIFALVLYFTFRFFHNHAQRKTSLKDRFLKGGVGILRFIAVVVSLFYIFWGFNYNLHPLATTLGFQQDRIDSTYLHEEASLVQSHLESLRLQIDRDTLALEAHADFTDIESQIRPILEEILKSWDFPTRGRVRVRRLHPKGILLRTSTAGIYIPHSFEGHIDAGLHPLQWPFTLAHEMTHGYGVTDEGECNFVGLLACLSSEDTYINYAGLLTYWRYLMVSLRSDSPLLYHDLRGKLPSSIKNDLEAIYDNQDKYPDILPRLRDLVYDQYLKRHGVHSGIVSYNEITMLMNAWKGSAWNREIYRKWYE